MPRSVNCNTVLLEPAFSMVPSIFLWGYLKAQVYTRCIPAIAQKVVAITPKMARKAMENFRERLRQCVDKRGRHLTDEMFKTK